MADTRQIVLWTLEQSCSIRSSSESQTQPSAAAGSVASARAYASALRTEKSGFGIFSGIYVSSYTYGRRPGGRKAGNSPYYPASGFIVSEELGSFGGPEGLSKMCHDCPANVVRHEIASCVGNLCQWPDSSETEAQLQGIISRLGLHHEVEACFPKTSPLWYGLWAVSPVPPKSLPVLNILLSEMLVEDRRDMSLAGKVDEGQLRDFSSAIAAVTLAERHGLRLHVRLLPLGHTDFGIYTVFPHCPFCKATAQVAHWQRKYPTELHTCHACGTAFSPAETATAERMDYEERPLRTKLGEKAFLRFAKDYLIAHGEPPEMADGIIAETEAEEEKRAEKNRLAQEMSRRRTAYLEAHVYAGLPCLPAPPDELSDPEETKSKSGSTGWFDAENFAEVLRRCGTQGIKITMMVHHSSDGKNDRSEMKNLSAPLAILGAWLAEGCRDNFYANCRVPDSFVADRPTPPQ